MNSPPSKPIPITSPSSRGSSRAPSPSSPLEQPDLSSFSPPSSSSSSSSLPFITTTSGPRVSHSQASFGLSATSPWTPTSIPRRPTKTPPLHPAKSFASRTSLPGRLGSGSGTNNGFEPGGSIAASAPEVTFLGGAQVAQTLSSSPLSRAYVYSSSDYQARLSEQELEFNAWDDEDEGEGDEDYHLDDDENESDEQEEVFEQSEEEGSEKKKKKKNNNKNKEKNMKTKKKKLLERNNNRDDLDLALENITLSDGGGGDRFGSNERLRNDSDGVGMRMRRRDSAQAGLGGNGGNGGEEDILDEDLLFQTPTEHDPPNPTGRRHTVPLAENDPDSSPVMRRRRETKSLTTMTSMSMNARSPPPSSSSPSSFSGTGPSPQGSSPFTPPQRIRSSRSSLLSSSMPETRGWAQSMSVPHHDLGGGPSPAPNAMWPFDRSNAPPVPSSSPFDRRPFSPSIGTGRVSSGSAGSSGSTGPGSFEGAAPLAVGSFDRLIFSPRLLESVPAVTVDDFRAELSVSGGTSGRVWPRLKIPFSASWPVMGPETPYVASVPIRSDPPFRVPGSGMMQLVVFNPNGTVMRVFLLRYNLTDMPRGTKTFVRQSVSCTALKPPKRLSSASASESPPSEPQASTPVPLKQPKLRYALHARFRADENRRRFFLDSPLQLVFPVRVPDDNEVLKTTYERPEAPRYFPIR